MAQYKNIDIVPDETITRVHLSQGDIGRTLIFYLFEKALSWSVPASSTIKCQGTKPSGFGFSVSCTYSGNAVTCVTTEEMTDEYGQIEAELLITSSDESQIFGTSNFILDIEKNPHPDGVVDGDAENPVIANLEAVITQAVDDWLDEHPEATTTVADGSITEPKLANALALKTINNYVTPQMYGAKADGITDDTTAIQNAINDNLGGTLFFPKGTYAISDSIKTYSSKDNFTNLLFDLDAVVIALSSVSYLLDVGGIAETFDYEAGFKKFIKGGTFDARQNVTVGAVMLRKTVKDIDMSDSVILTNGIDGLYLGESGGASQDAYIHHITVENNSSDHTSNGIIINTGDNCLESIRVYYYENDVVVNGGSIFLIDIHTLASVNLVNSHTSFVINSQSVALTNCYGDSTETFVKITTTNTKTTINQCKYYSYAQNTLTAFDLNDTSARLKISQFEMICPVLTSGKHTGIKVNSFSDFAQRTSRHYISLDQIIIDNAEYIRNGDLLKGGQTDEGYITFLPTSLTQGTWYKVGTVQWTNSANCIFYIEFVANGRKTFVPASAYISSNGTLTGDLHSAKVVSDDSANYKIGFKGSVDSTDASFGTIEIYLMLNASLSRTLQQVRFITNLAMTPSTDTSRPRALDAMSNFTPTLTYAINCSSGTIASA